MENREIIKRLEESIQGYNKVVRHAELLGQEDIAKDMSKLRDEHIDCLARYKKLED